MLRNKQQKGSRSRLTHDRPVEGAITGETLKVGPTLRSFTRMKMGMQRMGVSISRPARMVPQGDADFPMGGLTATSYIRVD